jgi:hypothetical protein
MVKGEYVEMFDFIKHYYETELNKDIGFEFTITNNQMVEKLVKEKYDHLKTLSE